MVPTTFKRILVPLDGSDLAARALSPAQVLAEQNGAELILFCAVPDVKPAIEFKPDARFKFPSAEEQRQLTDEAGESLALLVDSLKIHNINVKTAIGVGDPAAQIVDYVVDNDVDLIVMSSHGYTGLARWTLGSVARKVLDAVKCSVFIIRPLGEE